MIFINFMLSLLNGESHIVFPNFKNIFLKMSELCINKNIGNNEVAIKTVNHYKLSEKNRLDELKPWFFITNWC